MITYLPNNELQYDSEFHRDIATGLGVLERTEAVHAVLGSFDTSIVDTLVDSLPEHMDSRGYAYIRPRGVAADAYNALGLTIFNALESAGFVIALPDDIHEAYMIQYQADAELPEHVDTNFSDSSLIRVTRVMRGNGTLASPVTGEVDFNEGAIMVQDLSRPILHGAKAVTKRVVAVWDIPGSIIR